MNPHLTRNLTKLAIAIAAVLTPAATHADTFNFHVDLNLAGIVGTPTSPFFLDFQLNEGSGTLQNSVTISNFLFTGGSPTGSPSIFSDTATGDLGSSISIIDNPSSAFNEIFQGFTAGTTDIQFDVTLSQNVSGVTPDGFLIQLLDSQAGNPVIPTTDPNGTMLTVPIGSANTLADVATFTSISPAGATATASAVPEPSAAVALVGGAACLLGLRRRRAQIAA
ncbi:MAG: NF038129 family PEP-CTERM protein [Chthoniobacter sp.]